MYLNRSQQLFASRKDWGDHPGGWSKTTGGSTSACVGQPAFVRRMRTRRPRTAPHLSNENPTLGSDEASVVWKTFSHGKSCCWPSGSPSRTAEREKHCGAQRQLFSELPINRNVGFTYVCLCCSKKCKPNLEYFFAVLTKSCPKPARRTPSSKEPKLW